MEAQVEARRVPGGGGPWCWRRGWLPAPRRRRAPPWRGRRAASWPWKTTGATTQLVVAEISHSPERTAALEEIAAKYMADFPQTRVRCHRGRQPGGPGHAGGRARRTWWSSPSRSSPARWSRACWWTWNPNLDVWEERSSLTMAAKAVLSSMGNGRAFLMPITLNQDLVYYRSDWFEAYNQDKTEGLVYCRIWEDFIDAAEKLSDKGAAGLVFGGQEHLVDLSTPCCGAPPTWAAWRTPPPRTSPTWRGTPPCSPGACRQRRGAVCPAGGGRRAPGGPHLDRDQAVEAFINGEAITLIAGQDRMEEIAAAMDEGAWDVAGYPRGTAGLAVTSLEFTGFGVAASSQQVGNAVHFLTYLSGADNNTHLAKVCGTVPSTPPPPTGALPGGDGPGGEPADGPPGGLVLLRPRAGDVPGPWRAGGSRPGTACGSFGRGPGAAGAAGPV